MPTSSPSSYKPPAWQHYPKQWLGDDKIILMSYEARGMHLHLMSIAWQQDPPCTIPDDDEMILDWLGHPELRYDWPKIRTQVFRAWQKIGNRWLQPGLLRAWERGQTYHKNGGKGGRPKKGKLPENGENEA